VVVPPGAFVETRPPSASDVDGARALRLRRWLDVGTWVLLLIVAAPPVISSARNLYELGHRQLALPGAWALLVPLSVDAAALLCVVLTLRAVHAGQSAGMARVLVIAFAAMSSWLGYQEAALIGTSAARVFYPVMPVAAAVLLDMVIRHRRRDALERLGALEPALPRFRALRWCVAPGETRRAWAAGVRHGITDPAACLAFVREVDTLRVLRDTPVDQVRYAFASLGSGDEFAARAWLAARGVHVAQAALDAAVEGRPRPPRPVGPVTPPAGIPVAVDAPAAEVDLSTLSKRDAIRWAFASLGDYSPPAAVAWLAERGVTVDRREAYRLARVEGSARLRLASVGGVR